MVGALSPGLDLVPWSLDLPLPPRVSTYLYDYAPGQSLAGPDRVLSLEQHPGPPYSS